MNAQNAAQFYRYDAFISYRHTHPDKEIAEKLHKLLETYKVPGHLVNKGMPKTLNRIFRDREELPTSSNLTGSIKEALQQSRFLIVVCSPNTPLSEWVAREIEMFIEMGRGDKILTLLIEGEPEVSFPRQLLTLRRSIFSEDGQRVEVEDTFEPLAADIRAKSLHKSLQLLENEKLRLIAPIIGCAYDDLKQRHRQRLVRKRIRLASIAGACILLLTACALLIQNYRLNQAKLDIAAQIISDIQRIDERLELVYHTLDVYKPDEKLKEIRKKVAPALEQIMEPKLRQANAERWGSVLQSAFKDHSLGLDFAEPVLYTANYYRFEDSSIRLFYEQLAEVQRFSDSLLERLTEISREKDDQTAAVYNDMNMAFIIDALNNRSQIAYLAGMKALYALELQEDSISLEGMNGLKRLEPVSAAASEIDGKLGERIKEAEALLKDRESLKAEAEKMLEVSYQEYEAINDKLAVKPEDTWEQVCGKARSFRELGRIPEAVEAYRLYKQMFAAADPTAERFSDTAQQFTLQYEKLGVQGGVYLYELGGGGAAEAAGLAAGDIIIVYDGTAIGSDVEKLVSMVRAIPGGQKVTVEYLRMDAEGNFTQRSAEIEGGSLGAGIMPI